MSIRDELAQVIAVALAETNPSGLGAFDELSPNRQKQLLSRGGHAADTILARHAVVELPEPVREYQEQGPAAEWTVRGNGYALVRNDLTIVVSFKGAASPAEARQMAAALVAAANRAEAQP